MAVLLIGGDAKSAGYIEDSLVEKNLSVIKTTRRTKRTSDNWVYLNFENVSDFSLPSKIDSAIIIGGVTDYQTCENDYTYAHFINCVQIPALIEQFLSSNIFVCYISTNTVFSNENKMPKEYDPHNPKFNYAKLKSIAEYQILSKTLFTGKGNLLSIFRMTKNIDISTTPFDTWLECLRQGKRIKAFSDLFFAPVLFKDSADCISEIIQRRLPGIFHLSGEIDISYSEFAKSLATHANISPNLVDSINSSDAGVDLVYSHPITGLDMTLTTSLLGFKPVQLSTVHDYLASYVLAKNSF
jgi:dTDP-4-dehydrorhamnose reductase|tara:strand:- start:295 stop:1188 length:894 start_codon:yes stop_codon:yes gene_type:complete